ncbi:MAG: MFS transporter [Dehalococcoidia bacterium]|nr:MFS transporter [Dehalococcoidia bacterium]
MTAGGILSTASATAETGRHLPGSSTFASLSEPDYRWYFAGNIAFFMGMQMQFVLRGYLAFDLTNSASSLGLIALAISLPTLLVAPIAGVVADRVNKKYLLIGTQVVAAMASVVVTVLILGGWIQFWHLFAISLVTGAVFAINMPARSALVPLLVPQHKLMNAISLQMGGANFTRIAAPAMAGLLIAPLGPGWVYLITTGLFSLAVVSEFHLPKHGLKAASRGTNFFQEFREGLSYVRTNQLIGIMIATSLLIPLFGFPVQQMLPVFAEEVFNRGPSGLGLMAAMAGLGGLMGAIVSANMDSQPWKGRLMFFGGTTMGIFLFCFAVAPSFWLALACLSGAGIGQMLFMSTNNTVIQAKVPSELRGRVNSLLMMSFGVMPLGVLPLTAAADSVGAPTTVAFSSAILLVLMVSVFMLVRPLRQLKVEALGRTDLSPSQAAALVAEGKITQEEANRLSGVEARALH